MPKISFPMPTAKNRFQILNLHPKKHVFKKNMVLKEKITSYIDNDIESTSKDRFIIIC